MDKLIIDGIQTTPDPSRTILQVAEELGIHIPTLCYHKSLTPYGACRICMVETIWKGRSKLQTACTCPAWPGEVRTASEKVIRMRRSILELMLAEAPEAEEIRELAQEYGVEKTRYRLREEKRNKKCIMCGLCVRVCHDVMGFAAIGFENRGSQRAVTAPLGTYSQVCTTCGACAFVCPTGAIDLSDISDKKAQPIPSEFDRNLVSRPCVYMPYPQAVPNIPVIDRENCVYFQTGHCRVCETVCPPKAIAFDQKDEIVDLEVGTIVVATGYDQFDPSLKPELAYDQYENVITGLEFERLSSPSGPTGGKILIAGKEPRDVVFVHCVGSRDETVGNEYCSRVCCMATAKQAHLIKEKLPDATVTVLYMDVRAFGKGFEEFYVRVKEEGVSYRRANPSEIYRKGDRLAVRAEDTLLGQTVEVEADLVVLAAGMVPNASTHLVSSLLRLGRSADGFLMEAHPKLRPVETAIDGVYLAGCCQGPKDIPDAVAQAKGAAASAIVPLVRGRVAVEPITAFIEEDLCSGCRTCEGVCEYRALSFDEEKGIMTVNEALCKGCGACGATCPSGCITLKHFTDRQILAQIGAMLTDVR
jgi:heterodisulfide reductase subunit A